VCSFATTTYFQHHNQVFTATTKIQLAVATAAYSVCPKTDIAKYLTSKQTNPESIPPNTGELGKPPKPPKRQKHKPIKALTGTETKGCCGLLRHKHVMTARVV
jgi:hypothetical protein